MSSYIKFIFIALLSFAVSGCSTSGISGNTGNMARYSAPTDEAEWIRNGEPIQFEEQLWYPQDSFDVLLDNEVYLTGEYRGVQFFVEKADVRPFDRLYTKFGRNKFRSYRKRAIDD